MKTIDSLQRLSKVSSLVDSIRSKIILNQYEDKAPLSEVAIADEHGVSRGSVRTAFQALEKEGLIETKENGRKQIKGIDRKFIMDVYNTRSLLECEAIRLILQREYVDYSGLSKALHNINKVNEYESLVQGEKRKLANLEFHQEFFMMADNRPLLQCWKTIEPLLKALTSYNAKLESKDVTHGYTESHTTMIEMIIAKNPDIIEFVRFHTTDAALEDTMKGIMNARREAVDMHNKN